MAELDRPIAEIVKLDAPESASYGEEFKVTVEVKNAGTRGRISCDMVGDGDRWYGAIISLDPGESYTYVFSVAMPAKDFSGTVYAYAYPWLKILDDRRDFTVSLEVEAPPPAPKARIVELSAPAEAPPGGMFVVTVKVENSGDAEGFIGCAITRDDTQLAFGRVPLSPGESWSFIFSVAMPATDFSGKAKAYHFDGEKWVLDDSKEFTVRAAPVEVPRVPVKVRYAFTIGKPIITRA